MEVSWPGPSLLGVLILAAFLSGVDGGFTVEDETRLRLDKMTGYERTVRPDGQTTIEMSFQLTAISGVDIRNQQFSVAGWWSMHWSDSRLAWNMSDYNGIPVIQVFEDDMWTPTVVVDNSVNDLSAVDEDTIPLRVDSFGSVNWNPPGLLTVSCEMDITHFPFDTQVCALQITSFGYTIEELDIFVYGDGINLNYYGGDGEWAMLSTWNERATYTEGNYQYPRVYYYFKMERKPLYYGLNMLLPVIVTAVLVVFVFLLPAESGEKVGYILTVLLAFMVILTLIAGDLPTTASNTSLLELYIAVVLIMGALSVVLSIYVLEIYHRSDDTLISDFVRSLTVLGMRINCYDSADCCCRSRINPEGGAAGLDDENGHSRDSHSQRVSSSNMAVYHMGGGIDATQRYNYPNGRNPYRNNIEVGYSGKPKTGRFGNGGTGNLPQKPHLSRNHTGLAMRPVTAQSTAEDMSRGGEITWKTVSIVLDGFLLRVYILFLTVSSVVFITLLVSG